jgi:NAD-dependent SIR2 family protein deacetylase
MEELEDVIEKKGSRETKECADCGQALRPGRGFMLPFYEEDKKPYCASCAEDHGLPSLKACSKCKCALSDGGGRFIIRGAVYCWKCSEEVIKKL